ncbi:universal stress family protein [Corallococcus coralloides]|uniref:Universal stress family protein n=1 Tax=Corallococcus coralloides TaxID=184914 RepID=A0A410S3C7_CORCK|nr:universal stress protein [Corallococcus coralloides]QAT88664.1 universal stress family protein [Corallococcus coralloides]
MRPNESFRRSLPLLPDGLLRAQRGLRRVAVGLDFSLQSEFALARALRLPLAHGAAFSVLHVSPPLDGHTAPGGTVDGERCLRRSVTSAVKRLRQRPDVDVREELRTGDAPHEAAALAKDQGVEVLVVGRPPPTQPVKPLPEDAMVMRLVREVDASVLVVMPHPGRVYHRPIVAVNFSRESRRALELTMRLCPASTPIEVLHVVDLREDEDAPLAEQLLLRQEHEDAARRALGRFLAPYRETGRAMEIRLRFGDPCECILAEARERDADLLTLGMSSANPPTALTEGVLRHSRCDVLISRHAAPPATLPDGGGAPAS